MASTITISGRGCYPLPDSFTYGESRAVRVATRLPFGQIIAASDVADTAYAFALVALMRADKTRDFNEHAQYLDALKGGQIEIDVEPEEASSSPLAEPAAAPVLEEVV